MINIIQAAEPYFTCITRVNREKDSETRQILMIEKLGLLMVRTDSTAIKRKIAQLLDNAFSVANAPRSGHSGVGPWIIREL